MGGEGIPYSMGDVPLEMFSGLYFNLFWISDGLESESPHGKKINVFTKNKNPFFSGGLTENSQMRMRKKNLLKTLLPFSNSLRK